MLQTRAAAFLLTRSWGDADLSTRLSSTPCPSIAHHKTQRAHWWELKSRALFEGAYVYLHLARTGVTSLRCHLPRMLRSFFLGKKWGLGKISSCFSCSITQLNARRNGGFGFYFYKPSSKAFIFPLNTGMNDCKALLIRGRASELWGKPSPRQCITQRG